MHKVGVVESSFGSQDRVVDWKSYGHFIILPVLIYSRTGERITEKAYCLILSLLSIRAQESSH